LEKLLAKRIDGIIFNEHLSAEGALSFKHACKVSSEGIVSKPIDMVYDQTAPKAG
jgi:ATP-dependent DNA ligase